MSRSTMYLRVRRLVLEASAPRTLTPEPIAAQLHTALASQLSGTLGAAPLVREAAGALTQCIEATAVRGARRA